MCPRGKVLKGFGEESPREPALCFCHCVDREGDFQSEAREKAVCGLRRDKLTDPPKRKQ